MDSEVQSKCEVVRLESICSRPCALTVSGALRHFRAESGAGQVAAVFFQLAQNVNHWRPLLTALDTALRPAQAQPAAS